MPWPAKRSRVRASASSHGEVTALIATAPTAASPRTPTAGTAIGRRSATWPTAAMASAEASVAAA